MKQPVTCLSSRSDVKSFLSSSRALWLSDKDFILCRESSSPRRSASFLRTYTNLEWARGAIYTHMTKSYVSIRYCKCFCNPSIILFHSKMTWLTWVNISNLFFTDNFNTTKLHQIIVNMLPINADIKIIWPPQWEAWLCLLRFDGRITGSVKQVYSSHHLETWGVS